MALVIGLLGIAVAAFLPFAPVVAARSTLTWPGPGEQPVSATAFLTPYRPAELHVALPCSAVQAALAAPNRTVLFTTATLAEVRGDCDRAWGPEQGGWLAGRTVGRVVLLYYGISRDAYERETTQVRQWGWEGDP